MAIIKINDYITLNQGITSEEGEPIYKMIVESLSKNEDVTLDFENVTFLTTAFLNVVIGALYKDYTSEQLQTKLHVMNINDETAMRIKKVTTNAKSFYENEAKFNEAVDSSIYGNV
jgi:anti-anti-sigma regulatory factor